MSKACMNKRGKDYPPQSPDCKRVNTIFCEIKAEKYLDNLNHPHYENEDTWDDHTEKKLFPVKGSFPVPIRINIFH